MMMTRSNEVEDLLLPDEEEETPFIVDMIAYRQRQMESDFWGDSCFGSLWKEKE